MVKDFNMASKFFSDISKAKEEKEVEKVYVQAIEKGFKNIFIEHPYECDGYFEASMLYDESIKVLRLLMEFKYGKNFNNPEDRAKVLVQVIYYLKKFDKGLDKSYQVLPNMILAGDKTTCFIIHVQEIEKYLKYNLDWDLPPSSAPNMNKFLINEILNDDKIKISIFQINNKFAFKDVVVDIKRMLINYNSKLNITENNIATIYDFFIQRVIRNAQDYSAQDLVYFFINVITDNIDTFLHSKKKGVLYVKDEMNIQVDTYSFNQLISNYSTRYKPSEEDKFNGIKDRLIEDTERRYNGEFYTPTIWVNEAHKEVVKILGEHWRDEYIVWDCAWGTGNLTRDYPFKHLYCSTLHKRDLELGDKYNINNIKFKYDFLNDDIDKGIMSLPKELIKDILKNKRLVFLLNPPYAEAGNGKSKVRKSKDGSSNTKVKEAMILDGYRDCSQQLYIQFLYRIIDIKKRFQVEEMYICFFSPTLFLTGGRYDKFRKLFLNEFKFENGFIFNASNFSDVSKQWEVAFSIWSSGEALDKHKFEFSIREIGVNGLIEEIERKEVYNLTKENRCNNWISDICKDKKVESLVLKSALNYESDIIKKSESALAYLMNDSNNVYANSQGVYILSCPVKRHIKTTPITKKNYEKCFSLFMARRLIKSNWINQKDEYAIPDTTDSRYAEWVGDSIVYSLFEVQSGQSSLRNIRINNKTYNVYNELFFMSNLEIKELADMYRNREVYEDCIQHGGDRFIYNEIKKYNLSKEAKNVLVFAKELISESFEYRDEFNKRCPNYQINCWDAGWYQVKGLLNMFLGEMLKSFEIVFDKLREKNIDLVYDLGFLNKNNSKLLQP